MGEAAGGNCPPENPGVGAWEVSVGGRLPTEGTLFAGGIPGSDCVELPGLAPAHVGNGSMTSCLSSSSVCGCAWKAGA